MDPSFLAQPAASDGIVELLSRDADGQGQKRAVEGLDRERQRFTSRLSGTDGTREENESLTAIVAAYDAAIDLVPKLAQKLHEQSAEQQ